MTEALDDHARLTSAKRLKKELANMLRFPPPLCSAGLKDGDLYEWIGVIVGPPDSPYDSGIFRLSLKFPKDYPFKSPRVRFLTHIYHCNVNHDGHVCVDILCSDWSAAITVSTLLLSICSLLTDPNPDNPLRLDIASLYRLNREEHDRRAREHTRRFAKPVHDK